mmetsp:Transcript_46070/g.120699  ORF Transcript_46070/g.120699 Transcript_46070/m.120699 type:complete len:154 (+) Transcript_46070:2335-2796(+)
MDSHGQVRALCPCGSPQHAWGTASDAVAACTRSHPPCRTSLGTRTPKEREELVARRSTIGLRQRTPHPVRPAVRARPRSVQCPPNGASSRRQERPPSMHSLGSNVRKSQRLRRMLLALPRAICAGNKNIQGAIPPAQPLTRLWAPRTFWASAG